MGVFRGARNDAGVAAWERWTGRPAARVVDYLATDNWDKIANPIWWVEGWRDTPYRTRMAYSVPMLPATGGSLQAGADGDYDTVYTRLARVLVDNGQANAIIRPGWEFNGDWYRWGAAQDPAAYARYFRRIVSAMRAVPDAAFTFDWCLNLGRGTLDPDTAYPGDDYVDYIGADVYDHGWAPGYTDPATRWQTLVDQPYGLRWQRTFARTHGKRISFPEWGLVTRLDDDHGGGDNPYYITRMADWIAKYKPAYTAYFDYDVDDARIRISGRSFPKGAAAFLRAFGGAKRSTAERTAKRRG